MHACRWQHIDEDPHTHRVDGLHLPEAIDDGIARIKAIPDDAFEIYDLAVNANDLAIPCCQSLLLLLKGTQQDANSKGNYCNAVPNCHTLLKLQKHLRFAKNASSTTSM